MDNWLLSPVVALPLYVGLVALLAGFGRGLAGRSRPTPIKTSRYASGEAPSDLTSAPGYQQFFAIALFFAVLHLGVVVLATSALSAVGALYLAGLILVLLALGLG